MIDSLKPVALTWSFLGLNVIDASIMLDQTVRIINGLSSSDRERLDPYFGQLGFRSLVALLCIFGCLFYV